LFFVSDVNKICLYDQLNTASTYLSSVPENTVILGLHLDLVCWPMWCFR